MRQNKEYKNKHDFVGKVITLELFKRMRFTYSDQNIGTEQNLSERMKHEILWDYGM